MVIYFLVTWLALVTSAVLVVVLWKLGDLGVFHALVVVVCCAAAAYLQFFGGSGIATAIGVGAQSLLAIYLVLRWKVAE
jgi:hypothetical protein